MREMKTRSLLAAALAIAWTGTAGTAVPYWGDRQSQPVTAMLDELRPGQWVWNPAAAPDGPIVLVVDLSTQHTQAYRNGILIGYATVSSGRKGHETPTGVFTTLQKDADHRSSIYNNAPMPYTQRLTWGGIALHAGSLPGYPTSHGCVHLPSGFAEQLFAASPLGMTVVVTKSGTGGPEATGTPPLLAPVSAAGEDASAVLLAAGERFRWQPEVSPEGPMSIVLSSTDRRVIIFRNGVEIGRSRIDILEPQRPMGTHVIVMSGTPGAPQWMLLTVPGESGTSRILTREELGRVIVPPEFRAAVIPVLRTGTTLLVTDASLNASNSGVNLTVVTNEPPEG